MKRNVVLRGLARLAASLFGLFVLLTLPASAAERAIINFIGYDEDSKYFAFEQFGENDGAGGYYSEIYIIDLAGDKWVTGTPFSFEDRAESGGMPLAQVRSKARALAEPTLDRLGIEAPPQILALNGDGMKVDRTSLTWFTPNCCGVDTTDDEKRKITLTQTAIKPENAGDCPQYVAGDIYGFSLSYRDEANDVVLHADGPSIPKSRGCVQGYSIYAVLANFLGGGELAVLEMWPFGFEGPDRRFLVVPFPE